MIAHHKKLAHGHQTSYLSQISQIISVEKNMSCGEISDFYKEFEQFMKFLWRNILHVEKFQIAIKNLNNLWSFIEIYAVF